MTDQTEADKARHRKLLKDLAKARDFPANTCPASRHAQIIGERLLKGKPYPMLTEEPEHCAETILAVVLALYRARSKLTDLFGEAL